jgi:hypothetical protein
MGAGLDRQTPEGKENLAAAHNAVRLLAMTCFLVRAK